MTDICSCIFPIWVYDKNDKEYFAMPIEVMDEDGIKKQKGDIEFVVNRDGQDIKFLAVPFESVGIRGIAIPETDTVYHDVKIGEKCDDVIAKQFTKLTWQKLDGKHFKKYDVRGHIFIAGCEPSDTHKEFDELEGKEVLKCKDKTVYSILHPIDEFIDLHILELEQIKEKKEIT